MHKTGPYRCGIVGSSIHDKLTDPFAGNPWLLRTQISSTQLFNLVANGHHADHKAGAQPAPRDAALQESPLRIARTPALARWARSQERWTCPRSARTRPT